MRNVFWFILVAVVLTLALVVCAFAVYGDIYKDVITNIPTNTTPNICITYPDHIATYLTGADTVVPLDDLLSHSVYGLGGSDVKFDAPTTKEIIPQFLNECAFDGYHYAMPYMRSTEACYVNKTYVEKLGFTLPEVLTWDFVWEVSQAATAKDAEGNFTVNGQKVILIHPELNDLDRREVCAHELNHALLHPTTNALFLTTYTFVRLGTLELEADIGASELLVSDEICYKYYGMECKQIAYIENLPLRYVELKMKNFIKRNKKVLNKKNIFYNY